MHDKYHQILDQVNFSQKTVSQYLTQTAVTHFLNEAKEKAQNAKVHIMLYGAYNAGKSTMINVLLKQNKAAVNDIPTTDSVDHYDWNGLVLVDTPGVNAPIEHQQVTEEHIKRIAAVLFVIREGDMDSRDVYSRLVTLLHQGKSVFIVLNNQLVSPEERYQASEKIRKNLKSVGVSASVADTLSIFPIDLSAALKGRIADKEKLVEHSGFQTFLSAFDAWINLQKEEKAKFDGFKLFVDDCWFKPAIQAAENKADKESTDKLRSLREQKYLFESERDKMLNETYTHIQQQTSSYRTQLLSAVGKDEAAVESTLDEMGQKVTTFVDDKFKEVSLKLVDDYIGKGLSNPLGTALDVIKSDKPVKAAVGLLKNEQLLKESLGWVAKNTGILKGVGKKMLGTWASRIAGVATVGMAIWDYFDADEQEAAANAQQRQQQIQRYQIAENLSNEFSSNAYNEAKQNIEAQFSSKIQEITDEMNKITTSNDKLQQDIALLNQAQSAMLAIHW